MKTRKPIKPPLWFVLLVAAAIIAIVAVMVAVFDPHIDFG